MRVALVAVVVIGALVVGGCSGDDDAAAIVLIAADDAGSGAFTRPVAELPEPSLTDFSGGSPDTTVPNDAIQVTLRRGDEPGLYAGSDGVEVCDRALLVERLAGAPTVATAWAGVLGRAAGDVGPLIGAAVAVETTVDLRVTSHRYADGSVESDQAVLQTGTAVLVVADGTPIARCLSGSPLTSARAVSGDITLVGDAWTGFAIDRLHTVRPAEGAMASLELVDPETGERVDRPVG